MMEESLMVRAYIICAVVLLMLVGTISCRDREPSTNNAGVSETQATANTAQAKLERLRAIVQNNGYSFQVGDTGLLTTPLQNLTGGKKMEFSGEIQKKLEEKARQLDRQGLIPSSKTFKAEPRDVERVMQDLQPPFDWDKHANDPVFDWRSHRPITPAKSQGQCGACWAFAAVSLTEAFHSVFYKSAVDISEQDILNCTASGGCGGTILWAALETMEHQGAALESSVGYVGSKQTCGVIPKRCFVLNFHGFVDPNWGIPDRTRMKQYVYQWGAVGTYIIATDTMLGYKGGVYDEFATSGDDHFVIVLGWDDNKPHRGGKGAWLIKNSWGTAWGENGFGWVAYDANEIGYNAQMVSAAKSAEPGCR
jgi:cathepsin L